MFIVSLHGSNSFFTVHSSLFTIHFFVGSSYATEAATRRVLRKLGESRCRPPEENGGGHCPLGAGRECERDNPRKREVVAVLRSPLSLRFSLSRSPFPHSLLSMCAPLSFRVLRGSVALIAFAVLVRLLMLPMRSVFTIHYSFFTIHCSLYPLGAVTPQKPPRGVYNECWESHAAGSRR